MHPALAAAWIGARLLLPQILIKHTPVMRGHSRRQPRPSQTHASKREDATDASDPKMGSDAAGSGRSQRTSGAGRAAHAEEFGRECSCHLTDGLCIGRGTHDPQMSSPDLKQEPWDKGQREGLQQMTGAAQQYSRATVGLARTSQVGGPESLARGWVTALHKSAHA